MMTMNISTYNSNCNTVYSNPTTDCYSNSSGYEHYQYHHHHHHHPYYQDQVYAHSDYCGTSNARSIDPLLKHQYSNVSYYDSMLSSYEYNNTSATSGDSTSNLRRSVETNSHYYPPVQQHQQQQQQQQQQQHYHQDDVNIITSSNGLSYTNLDYTTATENYSYHQKTVSPKEYVNYETLDTTKRESDVTSVAAGGVHTHEGGDCSADDNLEYLHQSAITDDQYQNSTYSSLPVKEESHYHTHPVSSSTLTALPDYSHPTIPIHHMHQNTHHPHHQSQRVSTSTQSQSGGPTYKWMQIKRNVPKPDAKCCRNEMNANQPATEIFEVFVAKRSAGMEVEDDDYQKSVKVKTVHFPDTLVQNPESLAVIELSEKITMCPAVQPACINWNKNETLVPKDGTLGLIPHWRTRNKDNSDTTHEMLQAVAMSYQSRETCQRRSSRGFLQYLTKDAFCVDPISSVTPAHRGAGFIYKDSASNLSYVQGVIYFTGIDQGPVTTFTNMFLNVHPHMQWINSIRQRNEKRNHRNLVLNARLQKDDVCKPYKNQDEPILTRSDFNVNNRPDDFLANGCELPVKDWQFLDYAVNCLPNGHEKECKRAEQGTIVPEFASLSLSCNEGYVSNGSNEVVCFRNKWSPPIEPCRKVCDKLQLENVNLKCFWLDKRIECNDNLKSGTTVVVECAPYYQSVKSLPKLVCDEYGQWSGVSDVKCTYFDPWSEQGEKDIFFNYTMQL